MVYLGLHDWGRGLVSPYPRSDAALYLYSAWFRAFVSPAGGMLAAILPPSPYVWLQTLAYRLLGAHFVVPYLLNFVALATGAVLISLATTRLFGRIAGWLAGILFVFCGPLLFYAGITMKTSLVVALVAGFVFGLVRCLASPTPWRWLQLSLVVGLLALERNNFLLAVPLLPLLALLFADSLRDRLFAACASLLPAAGLIAVVFVAQGPHPGTSPIAVNLYIGNSAISTGSYVPIPQTRSDLIGQRLDTPKIADAAGMGDHPEQFWLDKTLHDIAQDPGHFALIMSRKLLILFSKDAPGSPEQFRIWRFHRAVLAVAIFDYAGVLALALLGIAIARRRMPRRQFRIFAGLPAVYALTILPFFVNERYRFPILVMLIPFAALAASWLLGKTDPRRRALGLVLVLGIYLASSLLNAVVPQGPGWPQNPAAKRQWETRHTQTEARVLALQYRAVRQNQIADWRELGKIYAQRGFWSDVRIFARRAHAGDAKR